MTFKYDVFVSYAHADREWARRVRDLLASGGTREIFFDIAFLRAGDDWEERIEEGLASSRHFVALWSKSAHESPWVQREIATFHAYAKPGSDASRRQIFVNLSGRNTAYSRLHQIAHASLQAAYAAATPDAPDAWHDVGVAIAAGLNPNAHALEVPLVVMTLTRDQVEAYPAADRASLAAAFDVPIDRLPAHYGATRDDWQPLAGSQPVGDLLGEVKRDIEAAMENRQIVWRPPDPAFWTEPQAVEDYVRDVFLKKDLALLVIDPVALRDHRTLSRLSSFRDCFERPQSVIAVLPPCRLPILDSLKQMLRASAMPYLDEFLKPKYPARHRLLAQCVWNAGDADDICRHLLLAVGGSPAGPAWGSVFTGIGAAKP